MGFWDMFSVTGTLVTKAVGFGAKVIKPILNGITNIANVVKDTAAVLSMVPIIGAVSSQIGAAANIILSVSSAGAEIIGVGERFVAKHAAPEPSEPVVSVPPPLFMAPVNSAAMSTNVSPGIVPSNTPQAATVFNVVPAHFPGALPAPIIPKSNDVTYPERRILRVRRPSAFERNRRNSGIYQKDEVDELTERMTYLNLGGNVPKTLKTGGHPLGIFRDGGRKRGLESERMWV